MKTTWSQNRVRRWLGAVARAVRRMSAAAVVTTGSSSIAITFDDGPHPEFTPVLLSTLAAYGVTATFFFIGVRAQEHPDLVRRVEAEGHAVGSHSMTHPWVRRVSCATAMADFRAGRQVIEQILGHDVPLFRPPRGHLTVRIGRRLRAGDWATCLWTKASPDWKADVQPSTVVAAASTVRPGDIVLFHDTEAADIGLRALLERGRRESLAFGPLPVQPSRA